MRDLNLGSPYKRIEVELRWAPKSYNPPKKKKTILSSIINIIS